MTTRTLDRAVATARSRHVKRRTACRAVAFAVLATGVLLILTACGAAPAQTAPAQAPGKVELNQTTYNDVPLGGGGTGTVDFHGSIYPFAIGGLGVQGSAVAIIQTSGEVSGLADISQFAGTYRRAPDPSTVPGQADDGLWLQNQHGAMLHLFAPRPGRLPDIGTDALRVDLIGGS
jgi:hypothetical protein